MKTIATLSPGTPDGVQQANAPHVLLVVDQFMKTIGGGERIVLKLASLLPRFGFRVSILTFFVHPESVELNSAPCPVYLLPLQRTYDLAALRAALTLHRFLEKEDVRIVQTFFESSDLWGGIVTKVLSNAKLIWSRRDMGILRAGKHHHAYRLLSNLPDRVVAVSDQVRRHCMEIDGIQPDRVHTVYNGLNLHDSQPRSHRPDSPERRFVITTVGNIRRVKGHDVLIRAAAGLVDRSPGLLVNIAGNVLEPDYHTELQALVRDMHLEDHVCFLGGVTNPFPLLAATDVFVLPSRSEGFSNAIIEAMAASLPVVATDVGGNAEAVLDGVNGYIVPPEDPAALGSAISRLLADPALAETMGAAGKSLAAGKFTTEAMMRQLTSIYSDLLYGA